MSNVEQHISRLEALAYQIQTEPQAIDSLGGIVSDLKEAYKKSKGSKAEETPVAK